jgi:hypothetical protein
MSALSSLTFTTVPRIGANPTLDRRANIIARLEEQKLLLNDPRLHAKRFGGLLIDREIKTCRRLEG